MSDQEPLSAQLLRIIDQREDTIDLLREQIRVMNAEIIRLKTKIRNLEERND
jgi:phage shock protein A